MYEICNGDLTNLNGSILLDISNRSQQMPELRYGMDIT